MARTKLRPGLLALALAAVLGILAPAAFAAYFTGTDGDDTYVGGRGADKAYGLAGDDELRGTKGGDHMYGGRGEDLLVGDEPETERGWVDVLGGGRDDDTVRGGKGIDRIHGGRGNDTIFGGPGRDVINGGPGRDVCFNTDNDFRVRSCQRR